MRACVILYEDYKRLYDAAAGKHGFLTVSGGTVKVTANDQMATAPCFIEKQFSMDKPLCLSFENIEQIPGHELVGLHLFERLDELHVRVEYPFK